MPNAYTETSQQSWFGKILGSIFGGLAGLVLIPAAMVLLFWNEGRGARQIESLDEVSSQVTSVKPDSVDAANDQKLVYFTGDATTTAGVSDPAFGVTANALRLVRSVETYQWKEDKSSQTQNNLGGGTQTTTTYNYEMVWSDQLIDSSSFKHPDGHQNPSDNLVAPATIVAQDIKLGAFAIPESVISSIDENSDLTLTTQDLNNVPSPLKDRAQLANGLIYLGNNPGTPAVGDQKVAFKILKPGPISVLARQTGDTVEPYPTKAGPEIMLAESGTISPDLLIDHAKSENTMMTWLLRGVGFVLMLIGFALVFSPAKAVADVVPFLGGLVGMGTMLFATLLSLMLSLITIAAGWIFYRPLYAIALLVGAGLIGFAAVRLGGRFGAGKKAL